MRKRRHLRHVGGEMRVGSCRSESDGRCTLITFGDFCGGTGGGFLVLSDWYVLRRCI